MRKITRFKGGTKEHTINVRDIVLPGAPQNVFPEDNGIYVLMLLARDALLSKNPSKIWKEITVPDMWRRAMELRNTGKKEESDYILTVWRLTIDIVQLLGGHWSGLP